MTGFIAGMPFLGDLEKNIRCDRLETPESKCQKDQLVLQNNLPIFIHSKVLEDGIL